MNKINRMNKILIKFLSKLKGSKFSFRNNLLFVFNKGILPLTRFIFFYLTSRGSHSFPAFIGKNCIINHSKYLSTGSYFYLGSYSYFDCLSLKGVCIGDNVTIREFAWLQLTSNLSNPGISIQIGSDTYIGPRCNLGAAAPLIVGSKCQIGAGVSFVAENHLFDSGTDIFNQGVSRIGINIGDDCWIGNNVIILDGVILGKGCVVGAGAVVTQSFPDKSVIAGVPARLIKSRS